MNDAREPAHRGDAARLLDGIRGHQLLFWKAPREISQDRGVLNENFAVRIQRRHFAARVDLEIAVGSLLLFCKQDRFCLVGRATFFETNMRSQRASTRTEIKREHRKPSSFFAMGITLPRKPV